MPIEVDQISKRYTVCLLCLHYKFSVFLPKTSKKVYEIENSDDILILKSQELLMFFVDIKVLLNMLDCLLEIVM